MSLVVKNRYMSSMRVGGRVRLVGDMFMRWEEMGGDLEVEMGVRCWVGKADIVGLKEN